MMREPIQKVGGATVMQIKIDTTGLRHAADIRDEVVLQKTIGHCRYYTMPNVVYFLMLFKPRVWPTVLYPPQEEAVRTS
jgi:hypothetical protein